MAYDLDYPQSRTEKILMNILNKITGGSGGSSDDFTVLEVRDSIGYKAKAELSDKYYIEHSKNLPGEVDPQDDSVSFGINIYLILADNIDLFDSKKGRHFYDIFDVNSSNYKDLELLYISQGSSTPVFNDQIAQGYKDAIEQLDDNCSFTYYINAITSDFQHEHPFEDFEGDCLAFHFSISCTNLNPAVYNQVRSTIAGVFDAMETATHVSFNYDANENYEYYLKPKEE